MKTVICSLGALRVSGTTLVEGHNVLEDDAAAHLLATAGAAFEAGLLRIVEHDKESLQSKQAVCSLLAREVKQGIEESRWTRDELAQMLEEERAGKARRTVLHFLKSACDSSAADSAVVVEIG